MPRGELRVFDKGCLYVFAKKEESVPRAARLLTRFPSLQPSKFYLTFLFLNQTTATRLRPTCVTPDEQTALLALLRIGLWGELPDKLPGVFPLSADAWTRVYELAAAQTVGGLVFRAFSFLPDSLLPPDPVMARWLVAADRIERRNREMDATLAALLRLFRAEGLRPFVLKGQGVAAYYDTPQLRECGDIDLWFPGRAQARRALELVRRQGVEPQREPDGSYLYRWQGVEVEHHPRLLDLGNPHLSSFVYGIAWAEIKRAARTEAQSLPTPSPEATLLLLSAHILKHLIGRGIGLRQFCDMARAYHALSDRYDPFRLEQLYSHAGLTRWTRQLHAVLTDGLGLPHADLHFLERDRQPAPRVLREVMEGGNFGRRRAPEPEASPLRRKAHTLAAFWHNRRLSLAYAPQEAFWTFLSLARGNLA